MNTDNEQQTVSDADRSWLAAMIETEGSIVMQVNRRAERSDNPQNLRITPRVIFTNTDQGLVEHYIDILDHLGVGKHVRHTKPNNVKHGALVNKSYKDITYINVEGFKRTHRLLQAIVPFMYGVKKERAETLMAFLARRLQKSEELGAKNYSYDAEDADAVLAFLRLTNTPNYERVAGMLNECTREARQDRRRAKKRIYFRNAAERGYIRPSRRTLTSRESVRGE